MPFLPNIFSDPALKARQDVLHAQWTSIHKLSLSCEGLTTESWHQLETDWLNWKEFYESGSDWSSSSEKATNEWQVKAQEWTARLNSAGCRGSTVGDDIVTPDTGIPGVKDPPPLTPDFLDEVTDGFTQITDAATSPFKTLGWVATGIVVLIIVGLVIVLTKGKASGYGVKVGG
jgi:hypothetical protein